MQQNFQDYINLEWDLALPTFLEFLRIPSQSREYDEHYLTNGYLINSAKLLRDWIRDQNVQGLQIEFLCDEGYSPFIYGEIPGSEENDGTVLFYGHMDKQPPFEGWREGLDPYKPTIIEDKLYARGGADDGYSIFGTILAIKACQKFGFKHPRIIMLFEGDEESGSAHIYHYLEQLKHRIANVDLVICLDSGCANYEQVWETTTLRGLLECQYTVQVLSEGVHSGDASGIVPSSFRVARLLLDRIENVQTGEVHQDLQVKIPEYRLQQAIETGKAVGQSIVDKFPYVNEQMKPVSVDPVEAYINRIWKAQVSVIGADGLPKANIAGNVLRPSTTLKLSIRLPPTADPEKCKQTVLRLLTQDVPYGAKVTIDQIEVAQGWNCPENKPFVHDLLSEASQTYFKKPALFYGEGGTIPLMDTLSGLYPNSQFIVTGILGPFSNAHGPNEFLHIPYTKNLICSIAHFVATSYPHFKK